MYLNHPRSSYLCPHYKKEDMLCCAIINEGVCGVAILKDGSIVNLFKQKKEFSQALSSLISIGIINGGYKLDCYGKTLAQMYLSFGFLPIARCLFDESKADANWNLERDGKPDIYFMVLFSDSLERVVSVQNTKPVSFDFSSLPIVSYEMGLLFQNFAHQFFKQHSMSLEQWVSYEKNQFLS